MCFQSTNHDLIDMKFHMHLEIDVKVALIKLLVKYFIKFLPSLPLQMITAKNNLIWLLIVGIFNLENSVVSA